MQYQSFRPPTRILMGPGPSNVHPRVLEAMARPTIGHLDAAFTEMMEQVKRQCLYIPRIGSRFSGHGNLFCQSGGTR
jgi:alanine-glyoxylate transaminase/serine-glyoxylate transaminase/serine-pyruvate transaminase